MAKVYQIREYESFQRGTDSPHSTCHPLPVRTFDALEEFILSNRNTDTDGLELMRISAKRGVGKVISARNYVGVITMKDGTTIEILPKTNTADDRLAKEIFLDMLRSVKELPCKSFQLSSLKTDSLPTLEIFIQMFLEEVKKLVSRGLKSAYLPLEGNENFLRGKLDISRQIACNFAHKERFYIHYDIFQANRPENRLIKTTLLYLKDKTTMPQSRKEIRMLLTAFADIDISKNAAQDFSHYIANRNMKEYDRVLKWCRVFLMNRSFTAFQGSEIAFALLFPMEKLFESYVVEKWKKFVNPRRYSLRVQDRSYYLFDVPKRFRMRPDMVLTENNTGEIIIFDAKWKNAFPAA